MTQFQAAPPGRPACLPCRLAGIAAVVGMIGAGFAWTAGWLTPARLSAPKIIDAFEANAGIHAGYRRNHAKGLCVEGYFEGNGKALAVSRAAVFGPVRTPVTGRLAIPGGNPAAPDAAAPVRSLALEFRLAGGEQWRTAMNSTPVFGVRTPQQFYEQLVAARPDPATGKPDPKRLAAFFGKYPETQPFRQWVKDHPLSGSFATTAYYGINAFVATDGAGVQRAVRWRLDPETPASAAPADGASADFLARDLASRLAQGPLRWHLVVTVAQPGDPTADATQAWPAQRQQIDAGTLVLERQSAQQDGSCRDINYDPTILPRGLSPSDDPLLAARSSAYAESYRRRSRENAKQELHAGAGQ